MPDASPRTAADDDELVERLRALAWGPQGSRRTRSCLPERPFPPLTTTEVERAERELGYSLPSLLRRLYTEIGDGGFGPEGGLASLTPRRIPSWHRPDWPCATTIHGARARWAPPTSWFFLTGDGCTMEWYVSLTAVDHPVLLWDADGWEPDCGEDPHDAAGRGVPSGAPQPFKVNPLPLTTEN